MQRLTAWLLSVERNSFFCQFNVILSQSCVVCRMGRVHVLDASPLLCFDLSASYCDKNLKRKCISHRSRPKPFSL